METTFNQKVYWTPFIHQQWKMYIAATDKGLCFVGSQNHSFTELYAWSSVRLPKHDLVEDAQKLQPYITELIEYFEGTRKVFTFSVDAIGTTFQMTVWNTLNKIPYGKAYSYSDIAEAIQKPKSVRAVSTAIGANPVLITIPCHRVIGKNGKLTGFRGGLEMKRELLSLEKIDGNF
ncbi:methylated-DNA--[protein]-cysteine S-methyltransferase [Bacillus sp. LK2]|uniref:methylated-DNA--[protein]-cysteine S-methyltransferase n=1 Tax=Bacillus sp. LK2 TaxID=1628206 RepID=UPI000653B204|nr:methylated-DNA--[protein]-cysteine S-methyltransferase [Bacillus sp. LK2]KMN45485.1 cysteine methyltransferase [Bacillus sp. LK2]